MSARTVTVRSFPFVCHLEYNVGVLANLHTMCKGTSGAVYGLGFIGAVVFFIKAASSFGAGVLGFLKAIVWPAVVVYKVLDFLS